MSDNSRRQAADIVQSGKRQLDAIDKQIETLLTRILDVSNPTVIRSYESKVADLERQKRIMAEKMSVQVEPKGKPEDHLELALMFLANPWKLWETGHIALRRTVLKLAFTDRIKYARNEGPRTPEFALPFKALGRISGEIMGNGAVRED